MVVNFKLPSCSRMNVVRSLAWFGDPDAGCKVG
jgi:hypothetical protein